MLDALVAADAAYEAAEAAFLQAVRSNCERALLRTASQSVADAAGVWNTLAYQRLHAASGQERDGLDSLTERTELLSELWSDVAAAYRT
jgi:hypothetical protein